VDGNGAARARIALAAPVGERVITVGLLPDDLRRRTGSSGTSDGRGDFGR
jgi:hypothetical protein